MIWVRRALAVLLIPLAIPLLVLALLLLYLDSTVLSADFHVQELRKAALPVFLYDQLLPAAAADLAADDPNLAPVSQWLSTRGVVAVRDVLPPEWLQQQMEQVVLQTVPYAAGDAEGFTITVSVKDRLTVLGQVIAREVGSQETYDLALEEGLQPALEDFLKGDLPFGIALAPEQVVQVVRDVLPPEWLQARAQHIADELIPYLAGERDTFRIVIPLKDRIQAAAPALKRLLRESGAYQTLVDQVVGDMVRESMPQPMPVFGDVVVTADEVLGIVKQALPPEFVQEQAEAVLDAMVPYLTSDAEGFTVSLPLSDAKARARTALQDLATQKLWEAVSALPPCTPKEALDLFQAGALTGLPTCRPTGYSLQQIRTALGIPLPLTREQLETLLGVDLTPVLQGITRETVATLAGDQITSQLDQHLSSLPDNVSFSDADLARVVGPGPMETVQQARNRIVEGYVFTDADLREMLPGQGAGSESFSFTVDDLEQARTRIREGVTFTEQDLREQLSDGPPPAELRTLGEVRAALGRDTFQNTEALDIARYTLGRLQLVAALLLAAPLLIIGLLGGRSWAGRMGWAAVPLGLAAGLLFAASGPVYQGIGAPSLEEALTASADASPLERLALTKASDVAQTVASDLTSGLASLALVALVLAIVGLMAAIAGPRLVRARRGHAEETGT